MKVVFLDFDGVLSPYPNAKSHTDNDKFSKVACIHLDYLLQKEPDLKIVVSSAWRMWGLEFVRDRLKDNGIDPRRVIDITGDEELDGKDHRGNQISCWLQRNPEVKNFVIIDDADDIDPLKDHWVKTNKFIGLTENNVEKAIDLLSKDGKIDKGEQKS